MTRQAGISGEMDAQEEMAIDAHQAALIVDDASRHARRELEVRYPLLYAAWGLPVLVVYGALWLSVRAQHPYRGLMKVGPNVWLLVIVVSFFSAVIRLGVIGSAVTGVRGRLPRQWSIFSASLIGGTVALWVVAGALSHAAASRGVVDLMVAGAPMLSVGLALLIVSPTRASWQTLALGGWLLAVAAGGMWAGPVTVLAIYAFAGGGGFLAMATIEAWVRR
jgi:hypothetical protein